MERKNNKIRVLSVAKYSILIANNTKLFVWIHESKRRIYKMIKNSRNDKKQICLKLPMDIYIQLEGKAARRKLDKTNYLIYLIERDQDDMFSENAANILNNITCSVEALLHALPNNNDDNNKRIRPFVTNIIDGVNKLWQYLR